MWLARLAMGVFTVGAMVAGLGVVSAQDYPNKPIRILAGLAGGGGDFVARTVAQGISGPLGQPVTVDNRTGFIGAETVAKSPPDGYNLFVSGGSTWISPLLRKVPYDVVNDFSPVSLLVREVNILVVHPSLPVRSVKELIALGKARPGELNYGIANIGSPAHLASELFKSMTGVNIVNVPYKSTPPIITALIGGEVQLGIIDAGLVAAHVKSGKMRALAVTSTTPSALAPGLPTVAVDVPGFEVVGLTGIWAPAKTPAAIINRLNQEIVRVLNRADVKERFFNAGSETVASSPEQFAAFIKADMARMGKVIKDAGIKAE